MSDTSNDDSHRQLEEHQLVKAVPPVECARNEEPLHESSPDEEVSHVAVEHFVERPRSESSEQQPEENCVKDAINACEHKILLNKVSPAMRRNLRSSKSTI